MAVASQNLKNNNMNKSTFLSLNLRDLINGFIIAFLATALTSVIATLDTGAFPSIVEIKSSVVIGLTAGISYILKNVLENSKGELLKKDK